MYCNIPTLYLGYPLVVLQDLNLQDVVLQDVVLQDLVLPDVCSCTNTRFKSLKNLVK